ncbi:MAG TPA: aminotransferase class I/II-fold pyridoxal phosphate-dependent enzyme [Azonexus sp.]|nr:aminotransferase class I/II-fold pyridoxal phosphate-dependent enzyme [Azonexus sp.]
MNADSAAPPLPDRLDLSATGNPEGWPVPPLPAAAWHRLPEGDDGLDAAAATYYGNANLLPVAGALAATRLLPALLPRAVIACIGPLNNPHVQAWTQIGHRPRLLHNATLPRALAAATPYVLFAHPNDVTADRHPHAVAVDAANQLKKRGGWLIVDESHIDPTPEESLTPLAGTAEAPNLIVLRSLDHFFGLAGIRVGFVFAAPDLLAKMAAAMGPWTVAGPSRAAARLALLDRDWQAAMRARLLVAGQRLHLLLAPFGEVKSTALFATLNTPQAAELHAHLAGHDILVHHVEQASLLRVGLPGSEANWQRLGAALAIWKPA